MAKRCNGCMKLKTQSPLCEHCGYNENVNNLAHQLPVGTVLRGQYMIGKVLGQGGFGITYIGWDMSLEIVVAVKEYYPNGIVSRESTQSTVVNVNTENLVAQFNHNRQRFLNEARTLAKLSKAPQIVHVLNLFEENNTAYIVMEYLKGMDLRRYIQMSGGRISAEKTFSILRPIMSALEMVHEAGLVHRDISPDNIMLLPDGSAKLLDFGAAREVVDASVERNLSQSTEAILKHGFAPMEQYQRNGSLGPWTDVYALCATIYYCLTGKIPSDAPNRILEGLAVPWEQVPGLTDPQREALHRGMELIPKNRTPSVAQLQKELFRQAAAPVPETRKEKKSTEKTVKTEKIQSSATTNRTTGTSQSQRKTASGTARNTTGTQRQNTASGTRQKTNSSARWIKFGAAAVAVVILAVLAAGRLGSSPDPEDMQVHAEAYTPNLTVQDVDVDQILAPGECETETVTYRNGSYMNRYFDGDNELCRTYFDSHGTQLKLYVASYDDDGNLVQHLSYDIREGKEQLVRADLYTFNSNGDVLEENLFLEGELFQNTTYSYNKKGNCIRAVSTHGDGTVLYEAEYTYDRSGNLESIRTENRDGTVEEDTYDDQKNRTSFTRWKENGDQDFRGEYTYDRDGNMTGATTYRPDGTVEFIYESEFDADGNEIREVCYNADKTVDRRMEYTYASRGWHYASRTQYVSGSSRLNYYEYVSGINAVTAFGMNYSDYGYGVNYQYTTYNALGNSEGYVSYDSDGREDGYGVYEYDAYGDLLRCESTYFSSYNNEYTVYVYDGDYNLISNTTYAADGTMLRWSETVYNSNDQLEKETTYNADGSLYSISEYTYDDAGVQIESKYTWYEEDGSYRVSVSDRNYNTVSSTEYDARGNMVSRTSYEYEFDDQGRKTKQIAYNMDGKLDYCSEYRYNEDGTSAGSTFTSYDDDGGHWVTISDERGNTITSTGYDEKGNVTYYTRYEYEYDDNGRKLKEYAYDENGKLRYWEEYIYDQDGRLLDTEYHYS